MHNAEIPIDLPLAFESQRAAHNRAPFASWDERRDRLQRLRRLLAENEAAIEAAIDADFGGRSRTETQIAEIFPSLSEVNAALRHGADWMRPRHASVSKWFWPARARVLPRPLGVVGIIVPWNYPLFLAVGPLVAALAAGNRALIKMSEFTPGFAALMQQLVARHFSSEEVAVITGGPEVAAAFAALPFDHLVFTGSTAVGRKVMAAASAHLTPVTLELGGKSPTVVAPGYDLRHAAARILAGKLLNAGQTCIAPDYVLVQRGQLDALAEAMARQAPRMYPQALADADYTSIVNPRQYARLTGYLDEARAAGARVQPLFDGPAADDARHRLAPTLVLDPPSQLALMRDEIFGPILPLLPYDDLPQAVAHINAQPRPLALYWFDHDRARAQWALEQTHVGGACINETLMHVAQEELPFGGVGASGIGQYHGRWGFDALSKLTPVFEQARVNGMSLFMPPYRPLVGKLLALMKRY